MKSLLSALLAAALVAAPIHAQSTRYVILDGDAQIGYIIQGGTLLGTFNNAQINGYPGYPIRFQGDNFLIAGRDGSAGVEYTSAGVATGVTVSNGGQNFDQLLDGGTDGTYTYAARCCSGGDGIYRGDMSFGNLQLFAPLEGASSVTFAAGNNSVYATDFYGNLVQYSLAGSLLNTYNLSNYSRPTALAYESSTNSLWFAENGTNRVSNISLSGELLSTMTVAGLGGNFYGGEMAGGPVSTVPEPSTYALMAVGLAAMGAVARRRNRVIAG